ncbi:MAG: hypothetical protein SFZ02_03930 [bacterium]|nr:hypothetical protein [bacterium]
MPISVRYEDDNHIVVWVFEGRWTWEDYYSLRDTVNDTIEALPHTIDMIVDISNGSILPKSVLSHANSAARKAPENIDMIVIVGPSAFLRTFFQFFKRMYGFFQPHKEKNLHMVATLEEAYAILGQKTKID